MTTTTLILTLALTTAAFLSITAATAEPDVRCEVEDFVCTCSDPQNSECNGLMTTDCESAVGPTRDLMVGLGCLDLE